MRLATALAALLLAWGGNPAAAIPIGERDVLAVFAELGIPFEIEAAEAAARGRVFRLRSAEPVERSAAGALYLRATVTVTSLEDEAAGVPEIGRRLAAADPDLGLSYAWDYVTAGAGSIVHLHAECAFAEESFRKVARALARRLRASSAPPGGSFWCRCGGGCRPGAPFEPQPPAAPRLPAVRRPDGVEEGEYDNRLDPSGTWISPIGELSLMHHANRLAFSYLAVFGPTAHICEGAGIAGLVGPDRYEYLDEQGTVAFVITETEVRMELADGIASFCGAGWESDRFATGRFEPPVSCAVTAEHAHFHVVDTVDLERTPFTVGMGSTVAAVPAHHTGDEAWVIARHANRWESRLGLLRRRQLGCPAAPARPAE